MLHKDISNDSAPIIAFDMDSLLHIEVEKKQTFWDKVFKKKPEKVLNQHTLDILSLVWNKYDFAIYFVTFGDYTEEMLDEIVKTLGDENVSVTRIIKLHEWDDVFYRISNGRFQFYFTGNEEQITYLGRNTYHIADIRKVL